MTSVPKKLVDLIKNDEMKLKYSFEVTPEITIEDIDNIEIDPTFFAVTWHAKYHQCKDLDIGPLKTASFLRSRGRQVMMHLSCDLMTKLYLERVLAFLQEKEICNLFVVLGENYNPSTSDFKNTQELIRYIREISGTYFCIGVAGFCQYEEEKFLHLKEKIDAGANFIITQAFFEANVYKSFIETCFEKGINVPILPGIFPFKNYTQLTNFTKMCKVKVSDDLLEYLKKDEGNEEVSIEIIKTLIHSIRCEYTEVNFHFFTLNKLQNVCDIIKELYVLKETAVYKCVLLLL